MLTALLVLPHCAQAKLGYLEQIQVEVFGERWLSACLETLNHWRPDYLDSPNSAFRLWAC